MTSSSGAAAPQETSIMVPIMSSTFLTKIDNSSSSKQAQDARFVVVRYYLDRPGYDINHSSARMWKNPPSLCSSMDVSTFLSSQGIIPQEEEESLLVEIYLDKFKSYMLLSACETGGIVFDFSKTNHEQPGVLNVRLTDIDAGKQQQQQMTAAAAAIPRHCNTSQIGLFAFSMTVGLETIELTSRVVGGGRIDPSFVLTWGPYAFWLSGLLQFIVGQWEVTRNNVYGATAFMAFGSFWLANGTKLILESYFPDQIPEELRGSDPWGNCIRNLYILAFSCVLFIQTLALNRLSTILISGLIVMVLATAFAGWTSVMEWIQMIVGWMVSAWAFYVFLAEFTNEVYHREVFNLYPWNEHSSDEVFGTAGRINTLTAKAVKLRSAGSMHSVVEADDKGKPDRYTHHLLRSVMPEKEE